MDSVSSNSAIPGAIVADRSAGQSRAVGLAGGDAHVVGALVDALGGDAGVHEQRARDLGVRAPGDLKARAAGVRHAVDDPQRLVDRVAVRARRLDEQRPVDVEQQQHRRARMSQRVKDVSAFSDIANAAMSFAHAWMSSSWTISTEECM